MGMKVGIIGLCAMGVASATRLVEKGFEVVVFDIRSDQGKSYSGCKPATSPMDLASKSDVILVFLPYSHQVEQVALGEKGVVEGAKPGTVFVNMRTISPTTIQKISEVLAEKRIEVLGAPINSEAERAIIGRLALVVGGKIETYKKSLPVLECIGSARLVGGVGAGEVVKIINNLLLATCTAVNAEALVLGVKAGIDPETLVDAVIHSGSSNHPMCEQYKLHVLKRDFSAKGGPFSVDLMRKDLALALELGNELKVPLLFGAMADQRYARAQTAGYSANHHSVIVRLFEELAGVQIKRKE